MCGCSSGRVTDAPLGGSNLQRALCKATATAELSGAPTSRNVVCSRAEGEFAHAFEVLWLPQTLGDLGPHEPPELPELSRPQRPFPSLDVPGWAQLTFGIAIGVHGVVGKADFVSLASGVNDKICRKAKEEISAASCEDQTAAHGTEGLEAAHPPAPARKPTSLPPLEAPRELPLLRLKRKLDMYLS